MLEQIITAFKGMHWSEYWGVATGIVYIILAAKQNIWCWLFGIVSSLLSIYLFFISKLYAESILYFYYVLAGLYGWYSWSKRSEEKEQLQISKWPWSTHTIAIVGGIALSFILAWILEQYTDAAAPLVDAHTTIFSFIATYMTTRKILSTWVYWVVIDTVSVGLYWYRGLLLYGILMIIYTIMAIYAYVEWKKSIQKGPVSV